MTEVQIERLARNWEAYNHALEIERFRNPKATEKGLELVVTSNLRKNPDHYVGYVLDKKHSGVINQPGLLGPVSLPDKTGTSEYHNPKNEIKREAIVKKHRLVTLALNVKGANCGNCAAYRPYQPNSTKGFCSNPDIQLEVHVDEHCREWHSPDAKLSLKP